MMPYRVRVYRDYRHHGYGRRLSFYLARRAIPYRMWRALNRKDYV